MSAASVPRRRLLAGLAASAATAAGPSVAQAFASHGRVDPPQRVPDIATLRDDGAAMPLARLLEGRITAAHFMFTGCSSLCPILGATFAHVQSQLRPGVSPRLALLSLSVDALGETPAALQAWRARMEAGERWRVAVPRPADAERMTAWAAGRERFSFDVHSSRVLFFDAAARLVYRSGDLPRPEDVARLLREIDAATGS